LNQLRPTKARMRCIRSSLVRI